MAISSTNHSRQILPRPPGAPLRGCASGRFVSHALAQGLTQRELAERLGISESLVFRDERNEYHDITVERAQRIMDTRGETVTARGEVRASRSRERALAGAG